MAEKRLLVEFVNPWKIVADFNSAPLLDTAALRRKPRNLKMAERGGFEPPVRFYPYNGLANRRLQPLGHLSAAIGGEHPRVSIAETRFP